MAKRHKGGHKLMIKGAAGHMGKKHHKKHKGGRRKKGGRKKR